MQIEPMSSEAAVARWLLMGGIEPEYSPRVIELRDQILEFRKDKTYLLKVAKYLLDNGE